MPQVKLSEYECFEDLLPHVCAHCGEPAKIRIKRTFSWYPPWINFLLVFGLVVPFIVAAIMTKRMKVHVPMCAEHSGHWSWRTMTTIGSFFLCVLVCVGGGFLVENQLKGDFGGFICLGTLVMGVVWLITVAMLQSSAIRPKEISDRYIILSRVHQNFIDVLEQDRDEEEERERARKYDERDDYDDDLPVKKKKKRPSWEEDDDEYYR